MANPYLTGTGYSAASGTTLTFTTSADSPAGDQKIIGAAISGSNTVTGVSDGGLNTYAEASTAGAQVVGSIWVTTGATADVPAGTTITVTYSAPSNTNGRTAVMAGYLGYGGYASLDAAPAYQSATSGSPSIASGTLAQPAEIVFVLFGSGNSGGVPTAYSNCAAVGTASGGGTEILTLAYAITGSASSVTYGCTITSDKWSAALASFRSLASPFTQPRRGGTSRGPSLRGHGHGRAGAPPGPSPFYAPRRGGTSRGPSLRGPGGHGAAGTYTAPGTPSPFTQPGQQRAAFLRTRRGHGHGHAGAPVTPPPGPVVNQWAASSSQPVAWGDSPPGTASTVIPLDASTSVGGGTGTPAEGNWLFAIIGWHQAAGTAPVTVTVGGDDSHQWWRRAVPTSSAGTSRTTICYQPNIMANLTTVYVAPDGYAEGVAVLIIEVAGLGPWDTVTGADAGYANAATSLALSLAAPSQAAFTIAAAAGDSAMAGTALAGTGLTSLATVTTSNGVTSAGDVVLVSAWGQGTGALSAAVTGSAEDMSGMMLGVQVTAASPVPGGQNPWWPYTLIEAAFGSGYQTSPDAMTWTVIPGASGGQRLGKWDENTGIQYELASLEASELDLFFFNPDGHVSPWNPQSPYYPHIIPGTPVRMRAVPPGGNRWLVISRFAERWPQAWDRLFRGVCNATGTDAWSVINRELPTAYRAAVQVSQPYAWWPCDDSGVNNATSLVNAAQGNAAPLQIMVSPAGLSASSYIPPGMTFLYSAIQSFAADQAWMYGDSDSAAWSQTGNGSALTGRYLYCHDVNFPPLAAGVTIEGWWNVPFAFTGSGSTEGAYGQPYDVPLTLWEIASDTAPLAVLGLSTSGYLTLTTFTGSAPAVTVIYGGADLRDATWLSVTVTMTQSAWTAWVNGGVIAQVSGTASMAPEWAHFLGGADTGTSGGGDTAALEGMLNAEHSHIAIYPRVLPPAEIISHAQGAYAAFGQLPAPSAVTAQFIAGGGGGMYGPDGKLHPGVFFRPPGGGDSTLAAYVTGQAGALTSAPCSPEAWTYDDQATDGFMWLTAAGIAPEYAWWTAAGSGSELAAGSGPANYLYVDGYGSGAAVPAAASPLGDTVAERIERLLQAGGAVTPSRCIDPADAAVVAALDTGGQVSGSAVSAITQSDGGLLYVDNPGALCYWQRPHLAAQPVLWTLGPDIQAGMIPFTKDTSFDTDPQRIINDIAITQYDVTAAQAAQEAGLSTGSAELRGGLVFAPDASRDAAILASQEQNGDSTLAFTSYLQSQPLIQAAANYLFDNYGQPSQRVTGITVDAAAMARTCPAAWQFVLGCNVGDVFYAVQAEPGQPAVAGTWRITRIERTISFAEGTAAATITGDLYIPYEWPGPAPDLLEDEALADILSEVGSWLS